MNNHQKKFKILFTSRRQIMSNRGVSLVMAILIMGVILAIGSAISNIFLGEIKTSRIFEQSTLAYYAADSGAEAIIYTQRKSLPLSNGSYDCENLGINLIFTNSNLSCKIEINGSIVKSTGFFQFDPVSITNKAQRKVELSI